MPAYIKFEDVRLRLIGKVRFEEDLAVAEEKGRMPRALAIRLIDEAEGQVEQDLSPRYQAPFVSIETETYAGVPDRPTKNIIRTLCELKAVIRILETDFGEGSAVDAEKYIKRIEGRYKVIVNENLLKKPSDDSLMTASRQWAFPPLPGLKKNWFNTQADDGYAGMVISHSNSNDGDYPSRQISDPSESFMNFDPDHEDNN